MLRILLPLLSIGAVLLIAATAPASTGDLSGIIEGFMAKQFPEARSHFWVVNGTQWQAANEMVVDVNTIVQEKTDRPPTENRYLLLIVEGEVAAAQNIPVDATTDCQPEQA
jgi:hypothetical protein